MATPKYILDDELNIINFDLCLEVRQNGKQLIFVYPNKDVIRTYESAADATTQFNVVKGLIDVADISSISMLAPTITTSAPAATIAHANAVTTVAILGTRFHPTAVLKVNSIDMLAVYDKSTRLYFTYPGTIAAGTYDIVYTDSLGRTVTLVNGIVLT